jgi:hypothetical protein
MYPHPLSDEEIRQLVREILENERNRYYAATALISHGDSIRHEICSLLQSEDDNIVLAILEAFDSPDIQRADRYRWDDSVVKQVESCLKSHNDAVRCRATVLLANITHNPEQYAHYLCDLASLEPKMRYVCMAALSEIIPVPSSCKTKLERLLVQYAHDNEFCETVNNRISEIQ